MNILSEMLYYFFGWPQSRCLICEKKDDYIQFVAERRSSAWHPFHYECVRDVIDNPSKYDHRIVGRAIWITELLEIQEKEREHEKGNLQKAKERLSALPPK